MRKRFRFLINYVVSKGDQIVSLKRGLKLCEMINGAAYCPYIHFVIVWLLLYDLWRKIQRCSHPGVVLKSCTLNNLGYTQIPKLDLLAFSEKNVETLDVSVNDVLRVKVLNPLADLVGIVPNVFLCKVFLLLSLLFEHL